VSQLLKEEPVPWS